MIYIEKNRNNEGIFYTSKYPLMSLGFNAYYHMAKDKYGKIDENNVYEELLQT